MPFSYTVILPGFIKFFLWQFLFRFLVLGVREAYYDFFLFKSIGLGSEAAVLFSLSIFALSPVLGFHGWLVNILMIIYGYFKKKKMDKNLPENVSD